MKEKTNLKGGPLSANHNETTVAGLRVKSAVKAGGIGVNHNEALAAELPAMNPNLAAEIEDTELEAIADALRVRTGLQAGFAPCI